MSPNQHTLLGKHRKRSKEPDEISEASQRSSLNAPETHSSSPASSSIIHRESFVSAQTSPAPKSRADSPDTDISLPTKPTPNRRSTSELREKPVATTSRPVVSPGSTVTLDQSTTHESSTSLKDLPPPSTEVVYARSTSRSHTPSQFSIRADLVSQASLISRTPQIVPQVTEQSRSMTSPKISSPGTLNGANGINGVLSPPLSPKALFRSKGRLPSFTSSRAPSNNFSMKMSKRISGAGSYKIGFVQENASALRKRSMAELGAGVFQSVSNV